MPQMNKRALSQFIRTRCQRQLALNLFPDNAAFAAERNGFAMPYPQSPRPGIVQIQQSGDEWQAEKLHDLTQTFGAAAIIGDATTTPNGQIRYNAFDIAQALQQANPVCFLVECQYPIGTTFQTALGISGHVTQFNLQYAEVRPDIVEVLPPSTFSEYVVPDGTTQPLPNGDTRIQLRVIDIKMTARASQSYFAEVAYYSMALAAWLIDQGLAAQFVVVPNGAVWPGTHEASNLVRTNHEILAQGATPTMTQLRDAMQHDLEAVPFDVFSLCVRRFLQVDVPHVLHATQHNSWTNLEWHVDNRCSFCEYLGEPRPHNPNDPNAAPHAAHCLPSAQALDHLSRVAFITSGARQMLTQVGVPQVAALAQRAPADPIFDSHQTLRATRTVVSSRASALQSNVTALAPQSGTSACMPRWSDLHVYLSVDFDMGSAISVAFGWKAFWLEPRAFNSPLTANRQHHSWPSNARIVVDRDLNTERQELLAFLQEIHSILQWCQSTDQQTLAQPALVNLTPQQQTDYRTKVQFYVWDQLQYQHLSRVIGRHLHAILQRNDIRYLAWLFPPEELLENPEMSTRRSPITVVREVIRSQLAAPIPHYYTLLDVARLYHESTLPANIAAFSVHPLFTVPLSDQIPSERAHEIWSRITSPRHWQQQMATYVETVRKRLSALETVTRRLESDLRNQLSQAAPQINVGPPQRQARLSFDGQLWFGFSKLNEALQELEVHQVRAMPPHQRAAIFRSARLTTRLIGPAEQVALAQLGLAALPNRRVYQLAPDSRDVKAKTGDFSFALSPENWPGFPDEKLARIVHNTALRGQYQTQFGNEFWRILMEDAMGVTIANLDRNAGLIAVDLNPRYATVITDLQGNGIANFDQNVILDPVHKDFFTKKLLASLRAIGNPPSAGSDPLVRRATGQLSQGSQQTAHTPTADFLWNCQAMSAASVARNLAPVRQQLVTQGLNLNPTQWQAWEDALSYRCRLVWGPPGTGKSRTVRAIVVGAILEAHLARRPLRVLVSAFTYNAIDNVLRHIAQDLHTLLAGSCVTYRIRSQFQPPPTTIAPAVDVPLNRHTPAQMVVDICSHLTNADNLIVIGSPPEQLHNLFLCGNATPQQEWFDLIVIDEASQMDVAHAVLPLCSIASDGVVVLAGDPMQLPPIHQAEPPLGLENLVGSVYAFYRNMHEVPQSPLGINYRSNDTIVAFARVAGYDSSLTSHSPQLRVRIVQPLPTNQPQGWPVSLHWTAEWSNMLNPDEPAVCFVYDDGRSSQRNFFEADAVAALLWLLNDRMANQLSGENDHITGAPLPTAAPVPYTPQEFWERAVGVVTPHRAQQGLIVSRLQNIFQATGSVADAIRGAVDTVERFQGQQRDVIIASYALGDPDQIEDEEEFLMSLNRFNVMASRARAKLIVLVSREVVDHLANDVAILHESRLLKVFVESFCTQSRSTTLGNVDSSGGVHLVPGLIRWRA